VSNDTNRELARLTDELLPALIARLGVSGLGELEVRNASWRVRLRREAASGKPPEAPAVRHADELATGTSHPAPGRGTVTAPAVGYFSPSEGIRVGQPVSASDIIGWVDVLGVLQEVLAVESGTVGRMYVEPGEAVEYGQELLRIDLEREEPGPPAGAAEPQVPIEVVPPPEPVRVPD
jgi:biotin carboxyl carrier protein